MRLARLVRPAFLPAKKFLSRLHRKPKLTLLVIVLYIVIRSLFWLAIDYLWHPKELHLALLNAHYFQQGTELPTADYRKHSVIVLFFANQRLHAQSLPFQCPVLGTNNWIMYGLAGIEVISGAADGGNIVEEDDSCPILLYRMRCTLATVHLYTAFMKIGTLPGVEIPVHQTSKWERRVVICLNPVRAYDNWRQMMTLLESARAQHVERVNVYADSMTKPLRELLSAYEDEKYVRVNATIRFDHYNVKEFNQHSDWMSLVASNNDCLYYYKYVTQFVVFMDVADMFFSAESWWERDFQYLQSMRRYTAAYIINLRKAAIRYENNPLDSLKSIQVSTQPSTRLPIRVAASNDVYCVLPRKITFDAHEKIPHINQITDKFQAKQLVVPPEHGYGLDVSENYEFGGFERSFEEVYPNFNWDHLNELFGHFMEKTNVSAIVEKQPRFLNRQYGDANKCLRSAHDRSYDGGKCRATKECKNVISVEPCYQTRMKMKYRGFNLRMGLHYYTELELVKIPSRYCV
uniref:Glycosyltransferase family 92 protein n=1 Tax=Panagrellus redivivus TaxID=6233 RepID=A0A7E4UTQ6_PANRE